MAIIPVVYFKPTAVCNALIERIPTDGMSLQSRKIIHDGLNNIVNATKGLLLRLKNNSELCNILLSTLLSHDQIQSRGMTFFAAKRIGNPTIENSIVLKSLSNSIQILSDSINQRVNDDQFSSLEAEEQKAVKTCLSNATIVCLTGVQQYLSQLALSSIKQSQEKARP